MKKLALLSLLMANVAFAGEAPFIGGFLGAELNSVKSKFSMPNDELGFYYREGNLTAKSSNSTGFALVGGYGFDLDSDFIIQMEGKLRINNAKTKNEEYGKITREYTSLGLGAIVGYRIADRVMSYIKGSFESAVLDVSDLPYNSYRVSKESDATAAIGFGYGAGVKVAISNDFELGAEWLKTDLRGQDHLKVKNTIIGFNGVYKF